MFRQSVKYTRTWVSGHVLVFSLNTKYADQIMVRIFRIKTKYDNIPADSLHISNFALLNTYRSFLVKRLSRMEKQFNANSNLPRDSTK